MTVTKLDVQCELDSTDKTILCILQKDGRISNLELAELVHLNPGACYERVKRLENEGYINGYGARLNGKLLGFGEVAFLQVTLEKTIDAVFFDFKKEIMKIPLVAECHMVVGGYDYLLKVHYEDLENYRAVLAEIVSMPSVAIVHSYMVIEQVKVNGSAEFPLSAN